MVVVYVFLDIFFTGYTRFNPVTRYHITLKQLRNLSWLDSLTTMAKDSSPTTFDKKSGGGHTTKERKDSYIYVY